MASPTRGLDLEPKLQRGTPSVDVDVATRKGAQVALPTVLSLAAFVFLVNGLAGMYIWGDSGYSVATARGDLLSITLGRSSDGHPPLFYYLLHYWMNLTGQSELALRFLSVAPAVLVPATVYRLGLLLFEDLRVARLAMALTCISPLLIYQSRFIRMYGLFTFVVLVAVYTLVAALRRGERRYWVAHSLAALVALYTHYYALVFLLGGGVYAALCSRAQPGIVKPWLISSALPALLYLPWAALVAPKSAQTTAGIIAMAQSPVGTLGFLGQTLWLSFNVGTVVSMPDAVPLGLAMLAAALALAVLAWRARAKGDFGAAAPLAVVLFVVIAVCWVIFLRFPYAVRPRFLMPAVPMYLLLLAYLASRAARLQLALAVLATLTVAGGMLYALRATYLAEGHLLEPQVVALTEQLQGVARPEDAVVFQAGWNIGYFASHFGGGMPKLYEMTELPPSRAAVLLKDHPRVWLARYYLDGSEDTPAGWLDRHWTKAEERQIGSVNLRLYVQMPDGTPEEHPNLVFTTGEGMPLLSVAALRVAAGPYRPSDTVIAGIRWQVLAAPGRRYTAFLHLIDERGERVAGHDAEPLGGRQPTDTWRQWEMVEDGQALLLPANLPPGSYGLRLGLYATGDPTAAALPTRGETGGIVARLVVAASRSEPPARAHRVGALFGGELALPAAEVDRDRLTRWDQAAVIDGTSGPIGLTYWPTAYRPGETMQLALYWKVRRSMDQDYAADLTLLGPDGNVATQLDRPLLAGRWPTSRWRAGELLVDDYQLQLPDTLPAGEYRLRLVLHQTGAPAHSSDGGTIVRTVRVER